MHPSYSQIIFRSWDSVKVNLGLTVGLTVVWSLIVMTLNLVPYIGSLFISPFSLGYLVCLLKIRQGESFGWEDFFWAFVNFNRVLQLTLLSLLVGLGTVFGFLLLIIPGVWFMIASGLSMQIFVMGEFDAVAALRKSIKTVEGHWWWFFGLMLVLGLLNFVGFCSLLLGLLFTIPVSTIATVIAYEHFMDLQVAPSGANTADSIVVPGPIN